MELDKDSILRAAAEAAEQMNGHEGHPQAPSVPLQPVPTAVQLSSMRSPSGDKFVLVTFSTPLGQNTFFFDPDSADRIADGLKETARLARTGLEIAR